MLNMIDAELTISTSTDCSFHLHHSQVQTQATDFFHYNAVDIQILLMASVIQITEELRLPDALLIPEPQSAWDWKVALSNPHCLINQDLLKPVSQDCVQVAFHCLQEWRLHNLPG